MTDEELIGKAASALADFEPDGELAEARYFMCDARRVHDQVYRPELERLRREIETARARLADELEVEDSPLCNCNPYESPPARWGVRLAHHCDCAAVKASAVVRRGESITRHGQQCCTVEETALLGEVQHGSE